MTDENNVEQEVTKEAQTEENQTETKAPESKSIALDQFYGQKAGMTRIFNDDGRHIPVTVIKLIPNFITQVKTSEKEGYDAYQVGFGEKRQKLINKPMQGHNKKSGQNLTQFFEIRSNEVSKDNIGKPVEIESNFKDETYIDVTSVSKGKGFQGVIKRYGFKGGPATHGSHFHRTPGSVGQCAYPGRIFKQKKMPGHMGSERKTVQNLKVVEMNLSQGYLLVKGSVPGHKNSFVRISKAVKK